MRAKGLISFFLALAACDTYVTAPDTGAIQGRYELESFLLTDHRDTTTLADTVPGMGTFWLSFYSDDNVRGLGRVAFRRVPGRPDSMETVVGWRAAVWCLIAYPCEYDAAADTAIAEPVIFSCNYAYISTPVELLDKGANNVKFGCVGDVTNARYLLTTFEWRYYGPTLEFGYDREEETVRIVLRRVE